MPSKNEATVGGVRISSADDVVYPGQGITKRELAEYYHAVREHILPELRGRPVTLVRCPEGEGEACFYQRHASAKTPLGALRRVSLGDGEGEHADFLVVQGVRALLTLVQMRVLEVHAWNARADRPDRPDRLVLDLDPGAGLPWAAVRDEAFALRDRLASLGLVSFVKTTGGKGLHVVAPLARSHPWARVRPFARALAEDAERDRPERLVAHAALADREGRIYVDYLRNGWGASAVAAYSTRARPGGTVSVPISWAELRDGVDPSGFTVRTVPARLTSLRGDPWDGYRAAASQRITRRAERALGIP